MSDNIINNDIFEYKSLIFTHLDDTDILYNVVINYENQLSFNLSRSIILQMEPWVYDINKNWGIKSWGWWTDPKGVMFVYKHENNLNPAQWDLKIPKTINYDRKNKIIAIISDKYYDTGHINRIDFIKYVESKGYDIIDIYGYENYHNFKNYKGNVSDKSIIQNYKYMLSAENNNEYNYATEKIWEPIVVGTLCFYDGCPNLNDYIDSNSYIKISLDNKHETLSIILNAIFNDEWNTKICHILSERIKVINNYNIFEIIHKIIYKIVYE